MKQILILLICLFSINDYSQGCVNRIVCSDDMATIYLLDGTWLSWGKNQFGQLGNGTTDRQDNFIEIVNGDNWSDVNHARMHTVAIHQNGTIWAWGNNTVGQLGNGNTTNSYIPVQVGTDNNWFLISPGNLHTVALKNDRTLWGWGNTGAFELTNGPAPFYHVNPIELSASTDWNKIYGGYFKTFAIKNNGTLWGIGRNNYGDLGVGNTSPLLNLTQIGIDDNWSKISAAREAFTLGLKTNGTLWAWGNNQSGRLGDGTTTNRYLPVQIGTSTWKDIAAGNYHALAIKTDGTLWQWGSYGYYPNGIGIPESTVPVQVGTDSDWKMVAAGFGFSYAVKENNTLYIWGNNFPSLGENTLNINPTLVPCNQLNNSYFQKTSLIFYPNPIKDNLNISNADLKSFSIINLLGQQVANGIVKGNQINLSYLPKGIYAAVFYKVDGQSITHKFIKD